LSAVDVLIPPKLIPVFLGEADVRGAFGGRGSAKTRTFAKMSAIRAYMWAKAGREGIILCGRQFMNSLADSSLEEVKAAIRSEAWLAPHFDVGEKYIKTIDGRISYTFSGLDRSIDSIKSKARILLGWVDEAEPVTEEGWQILIPTLREVDSELWVTWNPKRKSAAVESRFRASQDPRFKVIQMNYMDNPWFPAKLERDRQRDLAERPDQYGHIWEGDFASVLTGAYFAKHLNEAKAAGRIGNVAADPLMQKRAFWDIGFNDATAIWVAQFVGREIRVLDYYEAQGQPLAAHLNWLRSRGYANAHCVLPHDGANHSNVTGTRFVDHISAAGFTADVIENMGRGADIRRIESARRLFPSIWFNQLTTQAGIDALGWYHEKRDETRNIGLGPDHDWSSHGADAFGLMCVAYEEPREKAAPKRRPASSGGWMG
jgi:phage terminase large subunit